MTLYLVRKEDSEWKLIKTSPTSNGIYVAGTGDKGDMVSLGNEHLSEIALEADEDDGLAAMVITKSDGSVQAVKTRGHGEGTAEAVRAGDRPFQYGVVVKLRPAYNHRSYAGTESFAVGYYATKEAARKDATHIRNRM